VSKVRVPKCIGIAKTISVVNEYVVLAWLAAGERVKSECGFGPKCGVSLGWGHGVYGLQEN
jgi:hypothetical protein